MNLKFKIARILAGGTQYHPDADYQELIQEIYDNRYRAIDKCPINLYILGTVESFASKSLEEINVHFME